MAGGKLDLFLAGVTICSGHDEYGHDGRMVWHDGYDDWQGMARYV